MPRHGKRPIKVPESTVRLILAIAVNPDFPKSFASMSSVTHVINGAAKLFAKMKKRNVETVDIQSSRGIMSTPLSELWRRFGMLSDRAAVTSICQNMVLVAYHVRCLVEVRLFASVPYLSNNGGPGLWGHHHP